MRGVVVGVDGSVASQAALEWGLQEAVLCGLPLTAVRCWTDPVAGGYPVAAVLAASADELEAAALQEAELAVKDACTRVPGADSVEVRAVALRGGAAPALVRASDGAALMVVGTRSANALSRAILGSVSASVLHHATGPVAVVPEPRPGDGRPPRVVVGVDHSPASVAALQWAAQEARRRSIVLVPTLVRDGAATGVRSLALLEAAEREALRALVPDDAGPVEPEVLAGHAGAALLDAVRPQDLLVVGSRGRGGFAGLLLGSTSTQCAQHAPCPVVVVRAGTSAEA